MSYSIITPATLKALTVQEVKDYLRVDSSDEDTLLGVLIDAATQIGEHYLGRFLLTTVIEEFYDFFPVYKTGVDPFQGDKNIIYLSRGPVQSVASVKYVDGNGDEQTVSASDYATDLVSEPARIMPDQGWQATKDTVNAVIVRYTCGYTQASDVPANIKVALLLIIGEMYEKRVDSVHRLPTASEHLLNPYRVFRFD
jgi:uncharacterized phiE125 gp8 family phage protein